MLVDGKEEYVMTIIMAAGKGTRMKTNKSKVVHKIYDKELVRRVAELAKKVGSDEIVTVVGHMREQVQAVLGDTVKYAVQEELLGTGHAVMQAKEYLKGKKGKVLKVLRADNKIVAQGINVRTKHVKARRQGEEAGIIKVESPINISKVNYFCEKCGKGVKLGTIVKDTKKIRVCRKCSTEIK